MFGHRARPMARRCGARCPPVHAAEPVRRTVVRIATVIAVTLVATLCFAAVSARTITGAESISTIAGTGMAGYNGDGIAAPGAQLNWPNSVLRASNGDTYIADTFGQRVRKVDAGPGGSRPWPGPGFSATTVAGFLRRVPSSAGPPVYCSTELTTPTSPSGTETGCDGSTRAAPSPPSPAPARLATTVTESRRPQRSCARRQIVALSGSSVELGTSSSAQGARVRKVDPSGIISTRRRNRSVAAIVATTVKRRDPSRLSANLTASLTASRSMPVREPADRGVLELWAGDDTGGRRR